MSNEQTTIKQSFEKTIKVFMSRKRLLKRDLKDALGITYETLEKKFREPKLFTGSDRDILAETLSVSVDIIDGVINERIEYEDAVSLIAKSDL